MTSPASSPAKQTTYQVLPRFIRLRDAYFYLGMDRNRFNSEVRPYVTEVRIGTQGIAFDRLELDAWISVTDFCLRQAIESLIEDDEKARDPWDLLTFE